MENLNKIESDILDKIKNIKDKKSYETIKTEIFGKKGIITESFKNILVWKILVKLNQIF